jgi:hypothetical protein
MDVNVPVPQPDLWPEEVKAAPLPVKPNGYRPRQPGEHWRTTGKIFDICLDWVAPYLVGRKVHSHVVNVNSVLTVYIQRYIDMETTERFRRMYPKFRPITESTRRRLMRAVVLAMLNRRKRW